MNSETPVFTNAFKLEEFNFDMDVEIRLRFRLRLWYYETVLAGKMPILDTRFYFLIAAPAFIADK